MVTDEQLQNLMRNTNLQLFGDQHWDPKRYYLGSASTSMASRSGQGSLIAPSTTNPEKCVSLWKMVPERKASECREVT